MAIAPPLPENRRSSSGWAERNAGDALFRYRPDAAVYALDFDPRKVQLDLLEGWDREQDAYNDSGALALSLIHI